MNAQPPRPPQDSQGQQPPPGYYPQQPYPYQGQPPGYPQQPPGYPPAAPPQQPAYPPQGYPPAYQQQAYPPPAYPPPAYQPPAYQPQYPPAYPPQPGYGYPYPPPQKSGFGCGRCMLTCLVLSLISCLLLAALGGGGYYLVKNGVVKFGQRDLLGLLGRAPGEVWVSNYSSASVQVSITILNTTDETAMLNNGQMTLDPQNERAFMVDPGSYQIDFEIPGRGNSTCMLTTTSNDRYEFTILDQGTMVTHKGQNPASRDEMILETSSLCR